MKNLFIINSEHLYNIKNENGFEAVNICMSSLYYEKRYDDKGEQHLWVYNKKRTFELEIKDKWPRIEIIITFQDNTNESCLFDENNMYHWIYLFKDFLYRSLNTEEDKFWYKYLLIALNKLQISESVLLRALEIVKKGMQNEHFSLLLNSIKKYSKLSDYNNQEAIKNILSKYGKIVKLYQPKILVEGYFFLTSIRQEKNHLNSPNKDSFISLLDCIERFREIRRFYNDNEPQPWEKYTEKELEELKKQKCLTREKYLQNPFIYILYWVDNHEETLQDYSILEKYYSFYNKNTQIDIIRRLFYDVKQNRISFSIEMLKDIVYNPKRKYEDYLHILKGEEKQDKSIELSIECIENCIRSNGLKLQTLNGILDLAIRESCYISPQISFAKMNSFLQLCDGGILRNRQFNGFGKIIGYYHFDYETLSSESLNSIYRTFISLYTRVEIETIPNGYPEINPETGVQRFDNNGNPMFVPMLIKTRTIIKGYEELMNIFGDDIENPNYSLVEAKLKHLINKYNVLRINDREWQISFENRDKIVEIIVDNFLKPSRYQFSFDDKIEIGHNLPFTLSKEEIRNNIENYLQPYITKKLSENDFEIQCSLKEIEKIMVELRISSIQNISQAKKGGPQDKQNDKNVFLKREHQNPLCYCNPSVSKSKHQILGRRFLWCQKRIPCYYSSIHYNEYPKNMVDFLHIINHDIINDTQFTGLIPNKIYSQFIVQLDKSIVIYKSMVCQECGHILFPQKRKKGNYNYYVCKNEKCSNHNKMIYLDYCHKCGATIDSRKTKQCPNGIYICSHCLTCCTDEFFKKIQERHITEFGKSSPWIEERIRKGHNDKGKYFCPKCGSELSQGKECFNCHYLHK